MEEKLTGSFGCKEKVCIQTDKIYDSCRSKECIECMRVYLTETGQEILDRAVDVKCRKSEVIWVFSDVEKMPFNRGYYTVDLNFFFRVSLDVYTGVSRPVTVEGVATYNKKVVLFGSEGSAKIFTSRYKQDSFDPQLWQKTNMPKAVVEIGDHKMTLYSNCSILLVKYQRIVKGVEIKILLPLLFFGTVEI